MNSKEDQVMEVERDATEKAAPSKDVKKRPPRRQGKTSRASRQNKRRTTSNVVAMKEIREGIESRVFSGIDSIVDQLSGLNLTRSNTCGWLGVTSRGVGFLTRELFDAIRLQVPKAVANSGIDVHILYRVHLALYDLQLTMAVEKFPAVGDVVRPKAQEIYVPVDARAKLAIMRQTFKPVATLLNSLGYFIHNGVSYRAFITKHPVVEYEVSTGQLAKGKGKRQAVTDERLRPDYRLVSLDSLYSVVRALSDPTTHFLTRRNFAENNPIPGAIFSDQFLLTNPEDIMMQTSRMYYSSPQFTADVRSYEAFVSNSAGKFPTSPLRLDGAGSPAQLVSVWNWRGTCAESYKEGVFRCVMPLQDAVAYLGALCFNEHCNYYGYGAREAPLSVSNMTVAWLEVFRIFLKPDLR